jgi:hypothetical protein
MGRFIRWLGHGLTHASVPHHQPAHAGGDDEHEPDDVHEERQVVGQAELEPGLAEP